jgi:dynein heavy chain
MGLPGVRSDDISGRFIRHMFILSVDSFEDKTINKIFSSILDWHFAKGFDANVARLSKVSTKVSYNDIASNSKIDHRY